MQNYLEINGIKINNYLFENIDGINKPPKDINQNGFYFIGSKPLKEFESDKAFHIAFFSKNKWNFFKPYDGFLAIYDKDKKIYIYSSRKNKWCLI